MNVRLALPTESNLLFHIDHAQPFSAHWSADNWLAELAQPAAHVWAAYIDERMVGFVCTRGAVDQYEITNLAVDPAHMRQGVGRSMLEYVFEQLKTMGGAQVTLEVSAANKPACCLYQACAMNVVGVREKFYADGTDALIMGKRL